MKTFNFDSIIDEKNTQAEIFKSTSIPVIDSVLAGYNGTILAYGQTGSGKTHTMVGNFMNRDLAGVIPRSFEYIFHKIHEDPNNQYTVELSFLQIYLESIQDLLEPANEHVRIREDPEEGVFVEGVLWVKVKDISECFHYFTIGEKNRTTAYTKMNAHSSRSHAVICTRITKRPKADKKAEKSVESEDKTCTKSMLFLVDLAGSERVKKSKAENLRLEEAIKINYSLLVLGNCIKALTDPKATHISYRDSKLTRLLQESLGGNAKTSLIITISPSTYNQEESSSTLLFGQKAMKVKNKPIVNKTVDYSALARKLQEDLDSMNDNYIKLKLEYDKLTEIIRKAKRDCVCGGIEGIRKSLIFEETIDQGKDDQNPSSNQSIVSSTPNQMSIAPQSKPRSEDMKSEMTNSVQMTGQIRKSLINSKSEESALKRKHIADLKKLESFYESVIKKRVEEYEKILIEVDSIIYNKETEIDTLKKDNNKLQFDIEKLKEGEVDLEKEIKRLEDKVQTIEQSKVNDESDLINQLNAQIYDERNLREKLEKQYIKRVNELDKVKLDLEYKKTVHEKMDKAKEFELQKAKEEEDKMAKHIKNLNEEIKRLNSKLETLTILEDENNKLKEDLQRVMDTNKIISDIFRSDIYNNEALQNITNSLRKILCEYEISDVAYFYDLVSSLITYVHRSNETLLNLDNTQSILENEKKSHLIQAQLTEKNENYLKSIIVNIVTRCRKFLSLEHSEKSKQEIELYNKLLECTQEKASTPTDINKISASYITTFNEALREEMEHKTNENSSLNKEIEILRKALKEKESAVNSGTTSKQYDIVKLQSQLKLKEAEVDRLSIRLEEHLRTIRKLKESKEDEKSNRSRTTSIEESDEWKVKARSLQEEISQLNKQLQSNIKEKDKIIQTHQEAFDKLEVNYKEVNSNTKKQGARTGRLFIKEYFQKVSNFVGDLSMVMLKQNP